MAEDTQDQGTPSALRPRPGWGKAANNPEAIHSTVNLDAVTSTGYMDPSYDPPKLTVHSDAGEFDQSPFKEAQQGHRLARATSPISNRGGGGGVGVGDSVRGAATRAASDGAAPELEGAPRADGRPAWDSRFFLERTAWEAQPRTMLLRPPSTNAFPGSSVRRSLPVNSGRIGGGGGDSITNQGGGRVSVPDGLDGEPMGSRIGDNTISSTDGNGMRTTILPGLYVAAPPIWASPYGEQSSPGPSRNPTSPGSSVSPGPGAGTTAAGSAAPRPPRADLMDSYIGRAYSPDQSYFRVSGVGAGVDGRGGGSPVSGTRQGIEPDEGGVDGHGTHLPALERAGYGKAATSSQGAKDKEVQVPAAAKANAQKAAIMALGAVYMPAGSKFRHDGGLEPRSNKLVVAPPPLYTRSCRSTDDDGGRHAHSLDGGAQKAGADRARDTSPGGGPIWRPSGRQPIPETAPPVPKSTRQSSSGEAKETQEEADRRRAGARDPAIYSPERYPIVGMGWFMPPEKFPPNPVYAGVKAKYLEARPPHSDDEAVKTPHMPDIHSKPWLTPGKHLVTDSSAPPPKMTGTAGARPPYSFSPSATGTSVATGTLRSNKGTARSGRSGARSDAKGNGRKKRSSSSSSRGSGSGNESGSERGGEVDGDREVLAVIGGVRLMSIIRRNDMQDEARLEAEEDVQMAAEDAANARWGEQPMQGAQEEEGRDTDQEFGERRYSGQDASSARSAASPGNRGEEEGDEDSSRPSYERRSGNGEQGDKASSAAADDGYRGSGGYGTRRSGRGSSNEGADVRDGARREDAEQGDTETTEGRDVAQQEDGNEPEAEVNGGDDEGPEYGGDDDENDDDNDSVAAAAAMAGLGGGDEDVADEDGEAGAAAGDSDDGE